MVFHIARFTKTKLCKCVFEKKIGTKFEYSVVKSYFKSLLLSRLYYPTTQSRGHQNSPGHRETVYFGPNELTPAAQGLLGICHLRQALRKRAILPPEGRDVRVFINS